MPLSYEVFDGNRADVTTVKETVKQIESQYRGAANSQVGWKKHRRGD
jgi:transposase